MLDVREMLRRLRLGESARAVAKGLGVSRNTVREYVAWFEAEGVLAGDATALPSAAELEERLARAEPVAQPPRLMPYRDEISELVEAGLQVKVAWERFSSAHPDQHASYTAFRRFVRRYVDERPRRAVVRLEVAPGEGAQVDFGYAGLVPRAPGEPPAKTWVFVMTLDPQKTLETFDFAACPKLSQKEVADLATCRFIERHENVFFVGPSDPMTLCTSLLSLRLR